MMYITCIHDINTSLLFLILMLWHRQAIFELKGDKFSSSVECRIRSWEVRHQFASRLNAHSQTDWAIKDQTNNLNSTASPYDEWAFSPLDFTADWLSHLALVIYMFVVVNFDTLAQTSDFLIERRPIVFICWMQDSKLGSIRHNITYMTYILRTYPTLLKDEPVQWQ